MKYFGWLNGIYQFKFSITMVPKSRKKIVRISRSSSTLNLDEVHKEQFTSVKSF